MLEAAFALFQSRGYEAASVQAIADAAGIAKATFYHHFKSKDDLLNHLAIRLSDRLLAQANTTAQIPGMDALTRMRRILGDTARSKMEMLGVISAVGREMVASGNQAFYARLTEEYSARAVELLSGIIAQGVEEGSMHVRRPMDAAELVVAFFNGLQPVLTRALGEVGEGKDGIDRFLEKVRMSEEAFERLLGIGEGQLQLYDYQAMRAALAAGRQLIPGAKKVETDA